MEPAETKCDVSLDIGTQRAETTYPRSFIARQRIGNGDEGINLSVIARSSALMPAGFPRILEEYKGSLGVGRRTCEAKTHRERVTISTAVCAVSEVECDD